MALACFGILAAMALPNIVRMQNAWALWGSARAVESSLQWGRMHAIAANMPLLFEVREEGGRFGWIDPDSGSSFADTDRTLNRGILITSAPHKPLRFYPHGNAAPAGTYTIAGAAGSYSVIVTPGGRIRVQKN